MSTPLKLVVHLAFCISHFFQPLHLPPGPIDDSFYVMEQHEEGRTNAMKITGVDKSLLPDSISISGTMYGTSKAKKKYRGVEVPFTFVVNAVAANPFSSDGGFSVDFHLNIEPKDTDVVDRLYISASSPQEEKVFGHGSCQCVKQ